MQTTLDCTIIRGGTSKGVYVRGEALPAEREVRDRWILALFGTPDPRQIDGLGGADPLTSKLAIVSHSERPGIDVEYEAVQVGIDTAWVDCGVMCGNLASGVGHFALQEHLVAPADTLTCVRMFCRNNGKVVSAWIPMEGGLPATEGDFSIDGVPGRCARVGLAFEDPAGGVTGRLLPLGEPCSTLRLPDGLSVDFSAVDAAALYAFLDAEPLGLAGDEDTAVLDADTRLHNRIEHARRLIAGAISETLSEGRTIRPKSLKIAVVGMRPGRAEVTSTGEDRSITARILNPEKAHKAFAVGGAVSLGSAAVVEGTIPHRAVGCAMSPASLEIRHPAGAMPVIVHWRCGPEGVEVTRADVMRTARVLMRGTAFLNLG